MKEIKVYALVGMITAIIIYLAAPNMLVNRIEMIESQNSTMPASNSGSYSEVVKKVNKSVVSIYTRKSAARENIYFIDPREKALVKKKIFSNWTRIRSNHKFKRSYYYKLSCDSRIRRYFSERL